MNADKWRKWREDQIEKRDAGDRVVGQEKPTSKIKIAQTKAKGGSRMKTDIRRKNPRTLRGA